MPLIRSLQIKAYLLLQQKQPKLTFTWKMNNALINRTFGKDEVRNKIKDILEFIENEGTTNPSSWWYNESSA